MNQSRKYEADGIEKETLVQHEFTWRSWSEKLNVRAQGDAHEAQNQEHGRKYIEEGKVFQKCVSSHLLFSLNMWFLTPAVSCGPNENRDCTAFNDKPARIFLSAPLVC
jgi:hypothetical protein